MGTYTVKLDPSAVATGRAEFDINTGGIRVAGAGIDWGDAAVQAFLADLKFGSVPVDFRVPNRQVTIPLAIFTTEDGATIEETARRQLAEKVGLLHAEGGWLLRQRATGVPMYADVVDAILHVPDQFGETGAIEPDVNLILQCLPDFYGDEVSSDVMTGTQYIDSVIKQGGVPAVIAGDYPARMRIVASDTSGNDQHGMYVALRSKYYDSASTAQLVRGATQLASLNGSTKPTQAGTITGQVIQNTFIGSNGWLPFAGVMTSANLRLTHKGTYRVLARVQGTTVPTQLQLMWQPGTLTGTPEVNDPVYIPGDATINGSGTNYYVVDLGEVRIDPPIVSGTSGWFGAIQALADSGSNNTVALDALYFLPLDDGAGRLSVTSAIPSLAGATPNVTITTPGAEANDSTSSGTLWTIPASVNTGNRAEFHGPGTFQTQYYRATNWGLNIPSSATILGMQAGIYRFSTASGVNDGSVKLVMNNGSGGYAWPLPNKAQSVAWPFSKAWIYYGGPTDLWGQALTPAVVNDPNFGWGISALMSAGGPSAYGVIAATSITVYYQLVSGLVIATDAVMYANRACEIRTEGAWRYDANGVNPVPVRIQELDSLRLPPSLQEGRQCELFIDTSRGNLDPDNPSNATPDVALDALSAQVFWRPCYIERP